MQLCPNMRETIASADQLCARVQSIVTSHGQNDSGLFELNFRDERYLPFEGAGAISNGGWSCRRTSRAVRLRHDQRRRPTPALHRARRRRRLAQPHANRGHAASDASAGTSCAVIRRCRSHASEPGPTAAPVQPAPRVPHRVAPLYPGRRYHANSHAGAARVRFPYPYRGKALKTTSFDVILLLKPGVVYPGTGTSPTTGSPVLVSLAPVPAGSTSAPAVPLIQTYVLGKHRSDK